MNQKEIPNFTNYLIDEQGRVYSKTYSQFLSPNRHYKNDYLSVNLQKSGNSKRISIHRLVACAFIPNPENKRCVNHIDGDKSNNAVSNLEWCNHSENTQHAYKIGTMNSTTKGDYCNTYYNSKPVIAIKDTVIIEFISVKQCAREIGVNKSQVQQAIKKNRQCRGYTILHTA